MAKGREMTEAGAGHPAFVGWWQSIFHTDNGVRVDVGDIVERIEPNGRFDFYVDGVWAGGGWHTDFVENPAGYTYRADPAEVDADATVQLARYRLTGDVLEYCRAPERIGRPSDFSAPVGSGQVHGALQRIPASDPRIPADVSPA